MSMERTGDVALDDYKARTKEVLRAMMLKLQVREPSPSLSSSPPPHACSLAQPVVCVTRWSDAVVTRCAMCCWCVSRRRQDEALRRARQDSRHAHAEAALRARVAAAEDDALEVIETRRRTLPEPTGTKGGAVGGAALRARVE